VQKFYLVVKEVTPSVRKDTIHRVIFARANALSIATFSKISASFDAQSDGSNRTIHAVAKFKHVFQWEAQVLPLVLPSSKFSLLLSLSFSCLPLYPVQFADKRLNNEKVTQTEVLQIKWRLAQSLNLLDKM
jgi:hypothetical protein